MELAVWIIAIIQILRFIEEVDWEWWKNSEEKYPKRRFHKKGDTDMGKTTPCDIPVEEWNEETGRKETHYHCPFCDDEDCIVSCRDMCGIGVDD